MSNDENVRRTNTKICSKCNKVKVVGPKNWYRNSTCAACYQKEYKNKNPEVYRDIKLRHLYDISLDKYNAMLKAQDNTCAMPGCGRTENNLKNGKFQNFVVDHRHSDKKVRALLCHNCNKNVGVVEKHLASILEYLKKY